MFSKKFRKYTLNPALGLIPFLIFYIVYWITEGTDISLIAGIACGLIMEPILRKYNRAPRSSIGFYVVIISFAITLALWLLLREHMVNKHFYAILPELILVVILMAIRLLKSVLSFRFFRKYDGVARFFLSQFFHMASYVQYFFTLHIFVSIIYIYTQEVWPMGGLFDKIIFLAIPTIGLLLLMTYDQIRISKYSQKLGKEIWLPIVTEEGQVTGKMAKSESLKMMKKQLHPVVRIALVYDGQLYLQKRSSDYSLDPGALDHPFEKYILFKHEINIAVQNSIVQMIGKNLPTNFLLKYTFENDKTKRLIFLFVARLKNEADLEKIKPLEGKFWTSKQIDNDFGDDTMFSECFQLEYEYLKNMVLAPDEMLKQQASSNNTSNK